MGWRERHKEIEIERTERDRGKMSVGQRKQQRKNNINKKPCDGDMATQDQRVKDWIRGRENQRKSCADIEWNDRGKQRTVMEV